jgi:hypothetical protein
VPVTEHVSERPGANELLSVRQENNQQLRTRSAENKSGISDVGSRSPDFSREAHCSMKIRENMILSLFHSRLCPIDLNLLVRGDLYSLMSISKDYEVKTCKQKKVMRFFSRIWRYEISIACFGMRYPFDYRKRLFNRRSRSADPPRYPALPDNRPLPEHGRDIAALHITEAE